MLTKSKFRLSFTHLALGALFLVFLHLAVEVPAQTCPAQIGELKLIGLTGERKVCSPNGALGQCDLICPYAKVTGNEVARFQIRWVKSTSDPSVHIRPGCSATPYVGNGQFHPNRQVFVHWSGQTPDLILLMKAPALTFLKTLASTAIRCPGNNSPDEIILSASPPPRCRGGSPRGKIKNPVGKVDLYSYAFDKWRGPITSEFPVYSCDRVRTTGNGSSAVVSLSTPSGAEDRIDVMADTILEISGLSDLDIQKNTPASEGFFNDLLKGTIRWITPETPGEQRRREQADEREQIFNVRTPTALLGVRGTDFVISHDPVAKKDYLALYSGQVEIISGGEKLMLNPGQQIYTENSKLSPVYELRPEVWSSISTGKSMANQSIFSGARQISGKAAGGDIDSGGSIGVMFRGTRYLTRYERQSNEGTPIDVYFFEIRAANGSHAEQDGQKLWGRFVRQPAAGVNSKGEVQWWSFLWVLKNGRWEAVTSKGEAFQVVGSGR